MIEVTVAVDGASIEASVEDAGRARLILRHADATSDGVLVSDPDAVGALADALRRIERRMRERIAAEAKP